MRVLLLALVLPLLPRDLDVGVPPGTPLEWNREFRRPVPTGHRGDVPTMAVKGKPGSTVAEDRYKSVDYVVANLYDYFKITTVDIMTHTALSIPKASGEVSQDDVATGGGFEMRWNYPPQIPVELAWMAAMACIREEVHPEVVSWTESAAYCLELGEPSLCAAKAGQGKIGTYLSKQLKPLPKETPVPPKSKDPKGAMFHRLAAIELTGGFPNALDPTFARRTLAVGADSFWSVVECTKNPHTFLARNAVSVLGHFPRSEAIDELKKLAFESKDPVIRTRAILALARRGEKSIVPDLVKLLDDRDDVFVILAIHALGLIGDPQGAKPVADLAKRAGVKDVDVIWTAIPALGRMQSGKDVLIELERKLAHEFKGSDAVKIQGDMNTPTAEEVGARYKVLHQMCMVALGLVGEKRWHDEVHKRVEKSGADGVHRAALYLLIEMLAQDDEGIKLLKSKFVESMLTEDIVKLEALRALGKLGKADSAYLKKTALDDKLTPSVRGLAIQILSDIDESSAKDACVKIVEEYANGKGVIEPQSAFVISVAAQAGGRLGALDAKSLIRAVDRAFNNLAFARREGNNDPDITKAKVSLHPALLETLAIELGRTGSPDAIPLLKTIVERSRAPQGRAEATLALGAIPGKEVDAVLIVALEDKDGWVRYCAYKALAKRSSQEHFCDWIFGDKEHRRPMTDAYKKWVGGMK